MAYNQKGTYYDGLPISEHNFGYEFPVNSTGSHGDGPRSHVREASRVRPSIARGINCQNSLLHRMERSNCDRVLKVRARSTTKRD